MILAYMKKTLYDNRLWFSLLLFFSIPGSAACQVEETVIKTVFFQRFADFTTWPPASRMWDKSRPFVIGVFEKSKFTSQIEKTYSDKNIFNKKVRVKYISNISETAECHILYIPQMSERELGKILEFTEDKPILTISDTRGYARKGVHINLYTLDQSIRFEINESAVKKSGLSMSHLLLDFATIVTYQENP